MSRRSRHPRPRSSGSVASDNTYHSLNRAETHVNVTPCVTSKESEPFPGSHGMRRQDSGYESMAPASPPAYTQQRSSTSVTASPPRARQRPSVRRASKSGPVVHVRCDSIRPVRSTISTRPSLPRDLATIYGPCFAAEQHEQPWTDTLDHDDSSTSYAVTRLAGTNHGAGMGIGACPAVGTGRPASGMATCPPQTTHYWTSDKTRRLEYAAIDAASRGVRGWVMRHIVPDCIIPEDRRRVRFDDDSGSVVRYRLDLDDDEKPQCKKSRGGKKRKTWWSRANS